MTIDDPKTSDESCPDVDTVGNEDDYLDPGESLVCTATYQVTPDDVLARAIDNTANACIDDVCDGDTAEVPQAPQLYVLLDQSGSIGPAANKVILRYNAYLTKWKAKTQLAPYSLTLFNSLKYQPRYNEREISTVPKLTPKTFKPDGRTPLYDAATRAIKTFAKSDPEGQVTFVIFTDGKDNASKTATKQSLAKLIVKMKRTEGWRFIFEGPRLGELADAVIAIEAAEQN